MTKRLIAALALIMPFLVNAEKVYVFKMTQFGAVTSDGKGLPVHKSNKEIGVVISDDGSQIKVAVDHELLYDSSQKWYFDGKGALMNEENKNLFSVSLTNHSIGIGERGGTILSFSSPMNLSDFNSQYNNLLAFIKQKGRLKTENTSTTKRDAQVKNNLSVTLQQFVDYPFGLVTAKFSDFKGYRDAISAAGLPFKYWEALTYGEIQTSEVDYRFDNYSLNWAQFFYNKSTGECNAKIKFGKQYGPAGKQNVLNLFNRYKSQLVGMGYRVETQDNRMTMQKGDQCMPPRPMECKLSKNGKTVYLSIFCESHGLTPQSKWEWEIELIAVF